VAKTGKAAHGSTDFVSRNSFVHNPKQVE